MGLGSGAEYYRHNGKYVFIVTFLTATQRNSIFPFLHYPICEGFCPSISKCVDLIVDIGLGILYFNISLLLSKNMGRS